MKSKPTRAGDKEHGAEVICLHEDDYNHQGDPDIFPIKLAYNGIHHYLPIVQRSVCTFLDDYNSAMYHIKNARYKLKKLNGHMRRMHIGQGGKNCLHSISHNSRGAE